MRTGTEAFTLSRRRWLAAAAAAATCRIAHARASPPSFAAAWEAGDGGWRIGLAGVKANLLAAQAALEVPTRAHGLLWQGRRLLAVARRPGDWLVRWSPATRATQWVWIEPDRSFNGHVIASGDARWLYTTETNLETGEGLIGVRDTRSMEKVAEWATGGMDPHELLLDADGSLLVANGGIPTLPETGRLKIGLERMDASLIRLDTRGGQLLGRWRLDDPRLSLRHVSWGQHEGRPVLGIALQAEHTDAKARHEAPVLALFDGRKVAAVSMPRDLAGYGGDIAFSAGRFAVSCPRADGVALFDAAGGWLGFQPLASACALAAGRVQGPIWSAGQTRVAPLDPGATPRQTGQLRLDNHWLMQP